VKKAYWIDGRLLTERDLQDIRRQLEGFARVEATSDENAGRDRDGMAGAGSEMLPPKGTHRKSEETPGLGFIFSGSLSRGDGGCPGRALNYRTGEWAQRSPPRLLAAAARGGLGIST
jgi:hypothetical protein